MSGNSHYSDEYLNAFVDAQLGPEDMVSACVELGRNETFRQRVCELRTLRDLTRLAYGTAPQLAAPKIRRVARTSRFGLLLLVALGVGVLIGMAFGRSAPMVSSAVKDTTPAASRAKDSRAAGLQTTPARYGWQGAPSTSGAAATEVKVLFHVTSADHATLKESLDEVEGLLRFFEKNKQHARVEVLANGEGLKLLRAGSSPYAPRIRRLQREFDNLVFVACQNTLDRLVSGQGASAVLPGVVVIDSGVAQIMRRQRQGWAYIRV